jgi:acyl-CoA reductase-like NAD-dependent aldehyde dehydrogenase
MSLVSPVKHPDKLFIGGTWVSPTGNSTFSVVESSTEELFETIAEADATDVERAVAAARNAFDHGPWPRMSHRERAICLRAIATELELDSEPNALVWTAETGVLHKYARGTASGLAATFRSYADLAESFPFEERHTPKLGGELALVVREPVGVVGAIVPWNGAPGLTTNKVAPALLAGCSIVVKSSPEAPGSGYLLAEACERAGLPPGVLNVITAEREASEHLVRHPGVDKITFTGSTTAGRRIASLCGERIARCTLELGGKSPAIVFDDYDIGAAARVIAARAVLQTGQVCWSVTRVIVDRHRHDSLVEALSAEFRQVTIGNPFDPEIQMGPLATRRQRDRVEALIQRGQAEGAVLATGGKRPQHLDCGFFIEPTVFGEVDNRSTIGREEIFGPVLSVIPINSEEEALAVANDTIFGLNSAVFTNDVDRAYRFARGIRAGTVGHNGVRREHGLPFGGFKQSGIGREGGPEGLLPYLETKTIILDGSPAYSSLWNQ